mmetsp:Transcript_25051/g.39368  ORF Transcript_25051/g.39368 Transcript_25051/m.39368 type:complete len:850 (+) Transcript_25051:48-2597(+)
MIMSPIETTDPAAELAKAQSHLDRLLKLQQHADDQAAGAGMDETTSNENNDAATSLYKRAKEAQEEIQFIQLQRDVINLVNDTVKNSQRDGVVNDGGAEAALSIAKDQCTSLGLVLIRHANHHGNNTKMGQLYVKLMAWYTNLHKDTRQMTCNLFRAHLQKETPEYPSNLQSSTVIADIFSPSSAQQTHQQQQQKLWLDVAKCLIELQIVHDAVQMVQTRPIDSNKHLSTQWRFDIVDELCRPIAERLRYHFLGEQSGLFTASSASSPGGVELDKVSTMDRLPEWLFRYLREIMENHGAHSVVMIEGVQPLTDAVIDSLLVCTQFLSADVGDSDSSDAGVSARYVFMQLKQMYFGHSSIFFLREISRMARHALRANSFLNHPDMVGSECRDRNIALRGIEQLFLFDDLMRKKIESDQEGEILGIDPILYPVRMTDTFLTPREDLLLWWMGDERDVAIARLQKCAASTLPSCQPQTEDGSSSTNIANQQVCPPITDLFAALLYSSRSKANAFSDLRPQQMYVANVVAPLCSAYLELMHGEAKLLRQHLLSRDATKSFSGSDELLTASVLEWISMITGVHMAGQAVRRLQTIQNVDSDQIHSEHRNPLDGVIKSVFAFADAMVDEFVSVFVEQIMMERAKLAGYTMRAPFLISEHPHEPHERRGQREKDVITTLTLSPDLNDSIHVLFVTLTACQSVAAKVDSMDTRTAEMMYFGSQSIEKNLSHAVGCKFLDIGLDPMGMCPEIYLEGAKQFCHDVCSFEHLFHHSTSSEGPMERALAASRLMSLDESPLTALRDALCALISSDTGSEALFISDFAADSRLLQEAESMLDAKGFGSLALEEAVSIMNRRF